MSVTIEGLVHVDASVFTSQHPLQCLCPLRHRQGLLLPLGLSPDQRPVSLCLHVRFAIFLLQLGPLLLGISLLLGGCTGSIDRYTPFVCDDVYLDAVLGKICHMSVTRA
jgi:hypothetical protein